MLFENFIFPRKPLQTLQSDHDLNLYYNRARYLEVNRGRFWSRDVVEGSVLEPKSLHKYTYGHNDPVLNLDPSGNSVKVALIVGGILAAITIFGALTINYFINRNQATRIEKIFYNLDPYRPIGTSGIKLELGGLTRKSSFPQYRWVQYVTSNIASGYDLNTTVGTPGVPFLDRYDESTDLGRPYYYTDEAEETIGSKVTGEGVYNLFLSYDKYFIDTPHVTPSFLSKNNTSSYYAKFTTHLVGVTPKGSNSYVSLASVNWGYNVTLINPSGETNITLDPLVFNNPK